MSTSQARNNGAIVLGAFILGLLLLKSIVNHNTQGYRCPVCNLFVQKNTQICPRCRTTLDWRGVP